MLKSSSWPARLHLIYRAKLDAHSWKTPKPSCSSMVSRLELEPESENCSKLNPGNVTKLTAEAADVATAYRDLLH